MTLIRKDDAPVETGTWASVAALGAYTARLYSRAGGLTQFGAFVETLEPGSASSDRHWHEEEDELVYLLDGEATLVEDTGAQVMRPGDAACWKAGEANAHHLVNRSGPPCSYLVVGTRAPADRVHYADVDKMYVRRADGTEIRTRRDGSPLEDAP